MSLSRETYSSLEENHVAVVQGDDEEEEEEGEAPAHHPSAPPHESFDISTTVDPSYVISLIRKLLPSNGKGTEVSIGNGLLENESKTVGIGEKDCNLYTSGEVEAMETLGNRDKVNAPEVIFENQLQGESAGDEVWEECGCILWDLAASEDHAQLMVQNLVLEVLLANLMVSLSSRITEICLGILGNLACHEISRKQISSSSELVKMIVCQLFLDDVPSLCEASRVITLCLQGSECVTWAEALKSEEMLSRILWISENALNPMLMEKSIGVLLAVLESQKEAAAILLPSLMKLDIASLLINLLDFEMNKLKDERKPERYGVLDLILRTVETLSTIDDFSREICQKQELLQLLKILIGFPDKFEIASSCVTAAVVLANIITDVVDLASELSQDLDVLQGLFEVFTFAFSEMEAQNAIWSLISKLIARIQESMMSSSFLSRLVSILASNVDLIEEEILVHRLDLVGHETAATSDTITEARMIKGIYNILSQWKPSSDETKDTSVKDNISNKDVEKLLNICHNALRSDAGQRQARV